MLAPNKLSRFLSLVLRHKPEEINLKLDREGWAEIDHLLECLTANRKNTTLEILQQLDPARFTISDDGKRIRATDGHTIEIDHSIQPATPPEFLYHGTATRFLSSINHKGLNSRTSKYVHLTEDIVAAGKAGLRHGSAATLLVEAGRMHQEGYEFHHTENGLWLTETVPVRYLDRYS